MLLWLIESSRLGSKSFGLQFTEVVCEPMLSVMNQTSLLSFPSYKCLKIVHLVYLVSIEAVVFDAH